VVQASSSDNSPVRAPVLYTSVVQQKLSGGLRDRIAGLRLELGCRRAGQAAGSRQRHKTLAFGVARADLPGAQPDTAGQDYRSLWEASSRQTGQLLEELGVVRGELGQVQQQLENIAIQAVNQKSVMQYEQREKLFVIRKLEEMEAELRLLVYSEQLASQSLGHLRAENWRLRHKQAQTKHIDSESNTNRSPKAAMVFTKLRLQNSHYAHSPKNSVKQKKIQLCSNSIDNPCVKFF